jgi:uncharacterized protein (DUF2267 family)
MSIRTVAAIERGVHKTNEWIKDLAVELDQEPEDAWRLLKGYLQTLRDELTLDEAAQFAAQLPLVLRGAFYEGFDPSRQSTSLRRSSEFLALLAERTRPPDPDDMERVAAVATRVLRRHVTEGEFDDVLSQLPTEVRDVLVHG